MLEIDLVCDHPVCLGKFIIVRFGSAGDLGDGRPFAGSSLPWPVFTYEVAMIGKP